MTNALVYHVASGQAFFSGVALIVAAVISAFRNGGHWLALGRTVAVWLGLALIAVSSTPLPVWFYLVAVAVTCVWITIDGRSSTASPRFRCGLRSAVLATWGLGVVLELPHHQSPVLPRTGQAAVWVVGDSISAGMGGEVETWPQILARRHGIRVDDLSLAGATVATALKDQAGRLHGMDSLVLVGIGGNDILGETTADAFERGLGVLLARLRERGRTVVMLELPLPPFYHRFGAAQRRLARRHGVILVPKRVLLGVLTSSGATLDTVHLSRTGHAWMAEAMWRVIRDALEGRSSRNMSSSPESR